MKKLLILALLLTAAGASAQNQYYVSTSGSDSNAGTQVSPWRHISKAIASFALGTNGAQINVHAGTYSDENISCAGFSAAVCFSRGGSSPSVRLKLVCDTQWSVPSGSGCIIRDSSGNAIFTVNANNIDIGAPNQFGFDGSNTSFASGVRTQCNIASGSTGNCSTANSIHVLGNYFHDLSTAIPSCEVNPNGHPAIQMGIHHGPFMTDTQVIGNRITNIGLQSQSKLNGGAGCQTYYGMYIETQQALIYNNVIVNTAGWGIQYYSSPCQGTLANNDISRTEMSSIVVGGADCNNGTPLGSVTIDNNIVGTTGPGFANIQVGVTGGGNTPCTSSHPILLSNSVFNGGAAGQIVFNNAGTQACTTVANSHSEAPTTTFVSYTGGNNDNFQLKSGSVAIAGGTTACVTAGTSPCVPVTDFTAAARPTPPSVGAYDVAGGGTSPTGSVSPSSLNFGVIGVGSCSSPQTSTFTNTGAVTLAFGSNTIIGTNPGDFAFGGIGTCSASLPPGGSCTFSAKFCPVTAGARTAIETVPSNASNSPQNIALAGTGGVPVVSLVPSSLSFGSQQLGTTSAVQTVTLTNTGTGPLTNIVVTLP